VRDRKGTFADFDGVVNLSTKPACPATVVELAIIETAIQTLRLSLPELRLLRIGVLYGSVSEEDRLYAEECPRERWSLEAILEACSSMGLTAFHIDPTQSQFIEQLELIDLALINVHGPFGEDGRLQGLLDYMGIAYTHSGVFAGSVGADKILTKALMGHLGIRTPKFAQTQGHGIPDSIGYPLMAKASAGGSSVGLAMAALNDFQRRGFDRFFVEEYIQGRSITVGVIELPTGTVALPPIECVTTTEYYDEQSKLTGDVVYSFPNDLSALTIEELKTTSMQLFHGLGCRDAARVDFIVTPSEDLYALEINTVPGMHRDSNFPSAARAMGLSFEDVVLTLLYNARQRRNATRFVSRQAVLSGHF
jgi:D-alanine-D-alanine ligase